MFSYFNRSNVKQNGAFPINTSDATPVKSNKFESTSSTEDDSIPVSASINIPYGFEKVKDNNSLGKNNSTTQSRTSANVTVKTVSTINKFYDAEKKLHPTIFDFVERIRHIKDVSLNTTKSSDPEPGSTSIIYHYNSKDYDNPKYKYFETILRDLYNITKPKNLESQEQINIIRAYYANKEVSKPLDYSNQGQLGIEPPTENGNQKKKSFDTKDYYSPKYSSFEKFHYDFFPRYIDGKLVVPNVIDP